MSREAIKVKEFKISQTKTGLIEVFHVEKPYGDSSYPVFRVEVTNELGEKSAIELPYANLKELISAIEESKNVCHEIPHTFPHDELASGVGGGQ
ncbi:hypothetical protein [Malaciobacter canalis]|jgi:hypothetical protein|uniref:Uncharacterized protein n=1 Tax=Malaciobacter canalis TaxID=1912871 RepID=A0ABX4LMD9_9BACT|nr:MULTISPECIES: hypothetical protein [Malaciobacter]PHO09035.1 hypothetical protein CPG37_11330 [Malaciobacter canalis]QEE32316.1 hypothetical protein ACAN_0826 [Malaciobacter canalis]RYA23727.1 hypothetical protein CRU96_06345 [Malaciobacter halophilus]